MVIFYFLGVGPPCRSILCQFWLCEEAQCVYLRRHLGSPSHLIFNVSETALRLLPLDLSACPLGFPISVPELQSYHSGCSSPTTPTCSQLRSLTDPTFQTALKHLTSPLGSRYHCPSPYMNLCSLSHPFGSRFRVQVIYVQRKSDYAAFFLKAI